LFRQIDVRKETSNYHFLKSVKITLLSDANFHFVSEHNSEQSIVHYSSGPTVLQLKGVFDTMPNLFENHQPQRLQISTVGNALFIQNKIQMASSVDRNRKFFERILSTPVISKAISKLFGPQGCSDDKN